MAESMGGDMGLRVLQAVQALSEQVKDLGVQVNEVREQVKGLSVRMDRMEARMDQLEARMDRMEARMEKQEVWMQRLGLEFMDTREEFKQLRKELKAELRLEVGAIRTELMLGARQVHDRMDRNNDALHLMVSGLHRTTVERFDAVEQRLHSVEAR